LDEVRKERFAKNAKAVRKGRKADKERKERFAKSAKRVQERKE